MWISDLYEKDGRLLIRYTVCNHGTEPYAIDTPHGVPVGRGAVSAVPLRLCQNSQLGDEQAAKLKIKQETPVKVLDGQMQTARIAPGEEAVGVVALQVASSTQPDDSALPVSQLQTIGRRVEQWPSRRRSPHFSCDKQAEAQP